MKYKLIITAFCCLILSRVSAQQAYYFRHYQVENGLSHNTVMCSLQDEKGFMWFGTKDGLNRFDGTSFKIFRHDEDDSLTIGNDYIRYLHMDKEARVFAGTQRGLYLYHPRTESFSHIISSGTKSIKEVLIDAQGNLWFIAEGTLVQQRKGNGKVDRYEIDKFFYATSMCETEDGSFWVSTAEGSLKKYDPARNKFETYDVLPKKITTNRWIEKIVAAGKDGILIGTSSQGLFSFAISTSVSKPVISQNEDRTGIYVRDILQYKPGEYWLATESGIFLYNESKGSITNLKKDYHNPYSLSDNAVYTLSKDAEGGLWAGTFFGGINYYAKQHASFEKNFPDYSKNSISGNAVREIVKDRYGSLWIGTEDAGLNKIDSAGKITHFMPTGNRNSLSYYNIHGLLAVNDELWIGTFEHGLDVLSIETGKVIRHYSAGDDPGDLKSNFVFSILQTKAGKILVGTTAGVFLYHPTTDNFSPVPQLEGYTYHILEDSKGVWWTATISEGIKYYDPLTGKTGSYQNDPADKNTISNNMVNSLFEDSRGNLWLATEGGGVCRLSSNRKLIKRYTTKNGLPSNFVFKVLEDDQYRLWITTSKGLVQLDPATDVITVYTSANGLLSDQFNYNSGYKDATGKLFFGSVKGMISFHPNSFTKNNFLPPVYFTGFQVHNKELSVQKESLLPQSILYTSKIELPYNQSSFSIDFAALTYTAPQMNAYAYKMEGVDNKWTYLEKNRKVYFTDLSPGRYYFKVKAANNSGVWNEKEAVLAITILPPWWKSSTAYLVYAILFTGLAYFLFRNYHRRMQEKNRRKMDLLQFEKEKELYEAKMKFFTNIAHEIKTPLTLIKGPLERVMKKSENIPGIKNSLAIMERNTDRLIDLTSQLLDYRQAEAGGFSLSFTKENISKLLEEAFVGFKPLAEQKNLRYCLEKPKAALIAYADSEALIKILYNLLSNAVKYADKQVGVQLRIDEANDSFHIEIQNDGYTIPEEMREKIFEPFVRLKKTEKQKGTGIGLALARSLTELHHGKLYMLPDENRNIFKLTLPIYQERPLNKEPHLVNRNPVVEIKP